MFFPFSLVSYSTADRAQATLYMVILRLRTGDVEGHSVERYCFFYPCLSVFRVSRELNPSQHILRRYDGSGNRRDNGGVDKAVLFRLR